MHTGSKKAPQVIGFDYLPKESPTKHGWTLREGSKENLLSREDPAYGCTLRIKAEEDLCPDYDLVGELKECKAVEFVFRSESKFSSTGESSGQPCSDSALPSAVFSWSSLSLDSTWHCLVFFHISETHPALD